MDRSGKRQRGLSEEQKPCFVTKEDSEDIVADGEDVNVPASCLMSKRKGDLRKKLQLKVRWNDEVGKELVLVIEKQGDM
ncbi:hypothetical protein JCGZ_17644 [Jatropha curcas]|uniref:Uncharacterized protein n=1 Tax=Jatropha curcas TaxID=180498 RepID=A0A067JRA2_JATCU|nr:hypothetical protein JCGZ_17644 [Jatropha curcas]